MFDRATEVEKLWQQMYETFEKRPFDAVRTTFAMKGTANQVQFRLMKNISKLKSEPPNTATLEAVRADIMLAETVGFLSPSGAEKAQKQLDFITDNGEK